MATILKTFPVPAKRANKLDKFLDGQIWRLKFGRDFRNNPSSMRQQLYLRASKLRRDVRINNTDPLVLIVQAGTVPIYRPDWLHIPE